MPIVVCERRWLCRTPEDWQMQFALVHPAPLDRLAGPGTGAAADKADAAEADAAEAAADAEADAELEAGSPAIQAEGLRVGVTCGGAVGRPCPNSAGLMAVATRGRWAARLGS